MKVLNIATHDFSNMSHENANALLSVGVYCLDVKIHPHVFKYKTESHIRTSRWIKENYRNFDVIQLFHSDESLFYIVQDHPNVVIYHTGTRYRNYKKKYDQLFKGRKIITDQCEFLLHNPTFNYLAPHTTLKPKPKDTTGKLIVGHYPSQPDTKGTDRIIEMLELFKNDFELRISKEKVTHEENLKRVSECHIYVELFAPTQTGNPYGCFGVSAFEATAMGCLVVTNNINRSAYEDVYGGQPFLTPNTEENFINTITTLHDRETFEASKEIMHKGFYDRHSITSTGTRIKDLIYESKY
jgi:hypothetical protein